MTFRTIATAQAKGKQPLIGRIEAALQGCRREDCAMARTETDSGSILSLVWSRGLYKTDEGFSPLPPRKSSSGPWGPTSVHVRNRMSPSTSSHADYPLPSQGHQSPRPDQGAETPAAWGIGWRCPTLMIGLVTCGAMLSVGHHFYYRSFEETLVDSTDQQTWAIRIGTGFAFLIKSCLVSAVGVAAVQETWATLRRKSET